MPLTDTITSTDYWTAAAGLTITSAKWNAHHAIYRGHMLPVDGSISAASNNNYDLGSATYKWRNAYAGTFIGKPGYAFSTITAALSITTQHIILCDASTAAYTCTLPAANVNTGTSFIFSKIDTGYNQITIDGNGAEQINDTATTTIATYGEMLELICDGAKWYKKSRYIDGTSRSFTPTGSWSTNVSFTGKISRIGQFARIEYKMAVTGAVTTTSLYVNMPTGLTISTATSLLVANSPVGNGAANDFGTNTFDLIVYFNDTSTMNIYCNYVAATYQYPFGLTNLIPMTWANNDSLYAVAVVPIVGWEG